MAELGGRSAEEREAARRARELRRAQLPVEGTDDAGAPGPPETVTRPRRPVRRRRPARSPSPSRSGPPLRSHSRLGRVVALFALLITAFVVWFLVELFQPFHGSGHGAVTVRIPPHASTGQIADALDRDGVISCGFPSCSLLFEIRAKLEGGDLLSGTYHLKRDMSFGAVLSILTTPPPAAKTTEVTIVPGRTRTELARLLHNQGVKGSYLASTRHSALLKPTAFGAPRSTPDLEGFLYPDTYQLRVPIAMSALVADQLRDFKSHFATVKLDWARGHHLTAYDVLIVASMVEAEAATSHDRPLIASVIYNRLRLGMPLQIDATVRYAVGNYTSPITVSQLHSPSPWNTYTHKGLTPTPIDSPGLASIQAAAHPASTNFLFFVVKPCGNGEHAFASTYSQFLQEEQQYQAARSRRGGHSPEHCPSKP